MKMKFYKNTEFWNVGKNEEGRLLFQVHSEETSMEVDTLKQ